MTFWSKLYFTHHDFSRILATFQVYKSDMHPVKRRVHYTNAFANNALDNTYKSSNSFNPFKVPSREVIRFSARSLKEK